MNAPRAFANRPRMSECCPATKSGRSMKKRHVDHILRAVGEMTGERQLIIVGSQALHGKFPDVPQVVRSAEIDIIARTNGDRARWLNAIGHDSPFHESFGYYADPVDE